MSNKQGKSLALAGVFALTAITVHSAAAGQEAQGASSPDRNTTSIDLGVGLGVSSNPQLTEDAESSAFGRVSAYLQHVRRSARTNTRLSAYAENDTYFKKYGSKPRFTVSAGTNHAATEKLNVFGNLSASADFGGQLLGRIYGVPVDTSVPIPTDPDLIPTIPPEFLDPELAWADRRSYRLNGQVGLTAAVSARDSVSVSAGASRTWVGGPGAGDAVAFFQTIGWDRTLSERSAVGAQLSFTQSDYEGPDNSAFVVNPALTYRTSFSENWSANLSGGISIVRRDRPLGSETKTSPTFGGSLCRSQTNSNLCFGGGRTIQTSNGIGALSSWNANASYFHRLTANDTLQLQADYRRYRSPSIGTIDGYRSNYYGATVGLSHRLSDRFSVDGQAGYRRVERPDRDIKGDASASVSLRYRLGDL